MEEESTSKVFRAECALLEYVDSLKFIMLKPIADLEEVERALLGHALVKQSAQTLEFQSCSTDIVRGLISWPAEHLQTVLDGLSFERTDHVQAVTVLDLLTVLCILMTGQLEDKAKCLFRWYNLNQQGLLEEEEHYLMLRRLAGCLRKLRLIGQLDLSDDEARYLAMKARIEDTMHGSLFRAGLYFADFLQWIQDSEECRGFFIFIEVLDKLVDVLRTLDIRSERLLEIMRHKQDEARISMPLRLKEEQVCSDIFLVFKSSNTVSLAIPDRLQHLSSDPWVYVEVSREVDVQYPLYEIAQNIVDRHTEANEHRFQTGMQCCDKHYYLQSTQRVRLRRDVSRVGRPVLRRVDVTGLSPGSRYRLIVHSDDIKYQTVRVLTTQSHTPGPSADQKQSSSHGICILPAALSAVDFQQLYERNRNKFKEFVVFYTGAFCEVNQELHSMLQVLRSPGDDEALKYPDYEVFQQSVMALMHRQYKMHWQTSLSSLTEMFLVRDSVRKELETLYSHSSRQLLFYNGAGPLSDPILSLECERLLGSRFYCMFKDALEREYRLQISSLEPPLACFDMHGCKVFLVSQHNLNMNIFTLIQFFTAKLKNYDFAKDEKIVILVRSIRDLLHADGGVTSQPSGCAEWVDESFSNAAVPEDTVLTGKYELLHGEYLGSQGSTRSTRPKTMPAFQRFVELVFSCLISAAKANPAAHKEVLLVSCNWSDGENFELRRTYDGEHFRIKHDNLLPTNYGAGSATTKGGKASFNELIAAIKQMLSDGVEFEMLSPTELRVLMIDDRSLAAKHIPLTELSQRQHVNRDLNSPIVKFGSAAVLGSASVIRVEVNRVFTSVTTIGWGLVQAYLFELPLGMDSTLFETLTKVDREQMIVVQQQSRWSYGPRRNLQFLWTGLLTHCRYGVCIATGQTSTVCTFRTLPDPSAGIFSALICPGNWRDYVEPTPQRELLHSLASMWRPPLEPVYSIFCQDENPIQETLYTHKLDVNFAEKLHSLYQFTSIAPLVADLLPQHDESPPIHNDLTTLRELFPLLHKTDVSICSIGVKTGIHITFYGLYCCVMPRNSSQHCLDEIIDLIHELPKNHPEVHYLIIITAKLLIYGLAQFGEVRKLIAQGCTQHSVAAHVRLFEAILNWKAEDARRECKVIGCSAVDELTNVIIGHPRWNTVVAGGDSAGIANPLGPSASLESSGGKIDIVDFEASQSIAEQVPATHPGWANAVCFDYVILPQCKTTPQMHNESVYQPADSFELDFEPEDPAFPPTRLQLHSEPIWLTDKLSYEVLDKKQSQHHGVTLTSSHGEWYHDGIDELDNANVVYRVDFIKRDGLYVPPPEHAFDSGSSPMSENAHNVTGDVFSWLFVQEILNRQDLFEVLLGPIQGKVTATDAQILFEVNMDLDILECRLYPLDSADEEVSFSSMIAENVKAFQPFTYAFTGLTANTKYEIKLPKVTGSRVWGVLNTPLLYSTSVGVIITGGNCFANLGIVEDIIAQINDCQLPSLRQFHLLNKYAYEEYCESSDRVSTNPSMWALMGMHVRLPSSAPSALFHLAPQSLLSTLWNRFETGILRASRAFEQAMKTSDLLGELYLSQLETLVKDSIRAIFANPSYSFLFTSFSNICLHHSQYAMTDSSSMPSSMRAAHVKEVLRSTFTKQIAAYISVLYSKDTQQRNYFRSWQVGPLAFALLDLVSGRINGDKSENVEGGEEVEIAQEASPTEGPPDDQQPVEQPFTSGFIGRSQWKALRSVALDSTLYQLVVLMERPLVDLSAIPATYQSPIDLPFGDTHPWGPTLTDLTTFLQFWIEWISKIRKSSNNAESRSILFVSTHRVPYVTVFQDLKTGIKIHQLCVGYYSVGAGVDVDFKSLVLSGKIGSIRYTHKLSDTVNFRAESFGMDALRTGAEAVNSAELVQGMMKENNGYAELKLLLDTWKPTGVWSNINVDATENAVLSGIVGISPELEAMLSVEQKAALTRRSARAADISVLTVGPVLGVPFYVGAALEKSGDDLDEPKSDTFNGRKHRKVVLPVMIELDHEATVLVTIVGLFDGSRKVLTFEKVPARRPYVLEIGPLSVEDRYRVILTGIKPSPFNSFSLSTHVSSNETNVVVVNCEISPDSLAASMLMSDLRQRCLVPFSGINAVVHTNFQPDIEKTIGELQFNKTLAKGLMEYRNSQIIGTKFKTELASIVESLREMWRGIFSKPSYRELLRAGYNIVTARIASVEDIEVDEAKEKLAGSVRFLRLVCERLKQEYVDQLRYPGVNIYRAVVVESAKSPATAQPSKPRNHIALTQEATALYDAIFSDELQPSDSNVRVMVMWSDPDEDIVDCVLKQWLRGCRPAPVKWVPWVSINRRLSVELLPNINGLTIGNVEKQLLAFNGQHSDAEDVTGVRLIIVNGEGENRQQEADSLQDISAPHNIRLWKQIMDWKKVSDHREYCLICPSVKGGSRRMQISLNLSGDASINASVTGYLLILDSIYRSNEFERRYRLAEKEKAMPRKKLTAAAAKSKRAQKKKEEEEKIAKEALLRETNELLSSQIPDGYLLCQCCTESVKSKMLITPPALESPPVPESTEIPADPDKVEAAEIERPPSPIEVDVEVVITHLKAHFMGDKAVMDFMIGQGQLPADTRIPEKFDLIQLPVWVLKFCPNTPAVFVQDEVVLVCRQNSKTKKVLQDLDFKLVKKQIIKLYERSRLSELSRPEDLREVDFSVEGVTALFFKDLLQSIWMEALDITYREHMLDITDDFIRSFCFVHAMGDTAVSFASAQAFASSILIGLKCALQMKTAYTMAGTQRFQYILQQTELAQIIVAEQEAQELKIKRLLDHKKAERDAFKAADKLLQAISDRIEEEKSPKKAKAKAMAAKKSAKLAAVELAETPVEEENEEEIVLTEEELAEIMAERSFGYDSDVDDLGMEVRDAKLRTIKEQADAEEAELQKKLAAKAKVAANAEPDFDGEIDEDVVKELQAQRLQWSIDTLAQVVDNIVDAMMNEAVEMAGTMLLRDLRKFGKNPPTLEERRMEASVHLQRVNSERFKARSLQGTNASKFL